MRALAGGSLSRPAYRALLSRFRAAAKAAMRSLRRLPGDGHARAARVRASVRAARDYDAYMRAIASYGDALHSIVLPPGACARSDAAALAQVRASRARVTRV